MSCCWLLIGRLSSRWRFSSYSILGSCKYSSGDIFSICWQPAHKNICFVHTPKDTHTIRVFPHCSYRVSWKTALYRCNCRFIQCKAIYRGSSLQTIICWCQPDKRCIPSYYTYSSLGIADIGNCTHSRKCWAILTDRYTFRRHRNLIWTELHNFLYKHMSLRCLRRDTCKSKAPLNCLCDEKSLRK